MTLEELIAEAPETVSVLAVIGVALLLPLYLSQRRDVQRLRAWRLREPEHAATDLAASEQLLDRAETELEELLGDAGPATGESTATELTPAGGVTPATGHTPIPAATRVTHERPALERITMERAAIAPHARWRRFTNRATQPRVLVIAALVVAVLGAGAVVVSESILSDGGEPRERAARVDPADVTVAVLNGTSVNGLANAVASDVGSNGYQLGAVAGIEPGFTRTEVRYADGQKAAAQKVARDLGLESSVVEPFDRETRVLADGADVVVIAGEDRAQP